MKSEAIKRIAEVTELPEEDIEKIYGEYISSPACITVGQRMKQIREEDNKTLEDVSVKLSCSPAFLEIIEEGLIPPTAKISLAFADMFHLPWHQVFDEIKNVKV